MHRLFFGSAALSILAGCASNVTEPTRQARNDVAAQTAQAAPGVSGAPALPALPAGAPVTVVDVEDFDYRTVCKDFTKPGTRIVVGQDCYSVSENDARRVVQHSQVEAAMREQEEVTRAARERDLEHQLPVLMMRR